jgi:hypothetical protein
VSAFTTGGLAAWWKLDETAGREVVDSSDNHHDGVLNGNPIRQPQGGKRGGAVQFDGVRDFIDTGWADNLATWTVGVWVKGKSAPTRAQPPNGLVHREYNFQINWDHYKPEFRGAAAVRIGIAWHPVSFGNLDGGIWYHLVATFDGESIKAYKDGVLVDEDSQAYGRPNVEAATLKLGRHAVDQGYFAGTIDDVCIFSYALSVDEVKALYSGTTPTALTAPPVASDAKIVLAPLDTRARPVPPKRAKVPFDKLATANLNAWVKLQVLEQRVLVLETLKAFSDNWALARHKVVGLWSEKETLDYLQGRLKDKRSLPLRLHVFFLPELKNAAEDLRQKIFALAREAQVDTDTEIWMEPSVWVGSGESPFYLREGKIRTFYPGSLPRPDGGRRGLANGLVDPNDLEQHILWRLTMPKNLPLTFRIEYDEASSALARQVADTAKAVAKREGLTDLVGVTGALVEPVPESAFVGKWQALGNAAIQSVEFQPGGGFDVMMGEGSPVIKAGTRVKGTWVWTVREIMLDIGDPVLGRTGYPPYRYRATVNEDGNLIIERGEIYPQGSFMYTRPPQMIFRKVPPQSEPVKTRPESQSPTERTNPGETTGSLTRPPSRTQSTASLNAWVRLQVLEQRVVVLDALKPFTDYWPMARHKAVGAFSEKETLDYLQGRLKDKKSLPIRIHMYYQPETQSATEDLRRKIIALAREANADVDTEVRLEAITFTGSGESPFYVRAGKITTFYPQPVLRPDGGPQPLTSGLVDPDDLEQHILWRLTKPKNLPLIFRIEYDEASSTLAKQVADTAKAVAKRVGLVDLVSVAGTPVEPVPESAFLGKWQALGSGVIQSLDIQSAGVCRVTVGEGSEAIKPGTSVKGTWAWRVKEVLLDINDKIRGLPEMPSYVYRATVNAEGALVVERGEIWPQGSFMFTRPPWMIFRKVPSQSESVKPGLEPKPMPERTSLREATGITPPLSFAKLPVASLNARVSLQVLEQQVLVLDALKPLSEYWARARYTPVGLLSENEALDYVRGRLKDQRSLPLRIDICYRPETGDAAQRLHEKVAARARETNTDMQTDLRLQSVVDWAGSGVSTFFLREGKTRTFHPDPVRRPDGGPNLLVSGVVEANDLEQHMLWRLLHPGNVPLTFRIEYDDASSTLAKQVADTAKAVVKRVGLTELVGVTGVLVEPVPETVFLGRWQALTSGAIHTIEIQPRGVCLVTMDKGTQVIKAGANVPGMWLPTTKEIIVDIKDKVPDKAHYVYRAYVDTEGDLVVDRGVIYRQGSFHNSDLQPAVFRKVQ